LRRGNKKRKTAYTAAALIAAAAVFLLVIFLTNCYGLRLVLKNRESGRIYAAFPVKNGDRFSVEFVHSVNNSPVRDIYEIRNSSEIYVVETDYYSFGAGVQTELNPGETLEYGPDGSMQVKNIDKHIPDLIYVVGTVSDHKLCIGDEEVSLRGLCGKNSSVSFTVENTYGIPEMR